MGTTSEKLTYLNNTKQLLKENINNLGGNLTTEPFRQYASVLEDIYERIPKVSGIGTSLSLSPTMAGKIKLNEIQGDTLQDGTPTPDTPVEIQSVTGLQNIGITGKNLFDKDKITSAATIDGTKITMLRSSGWATNKILFPKKLTAGTTITASRSDYNVTNNAGIAIQLFNGDTSVRYMDLVDETYTLTLPSDVDSWRLTITYNSSSDTTGYVKDVQLEVGSATEYEPYKGNNYEVNLGNIELNRIPETEYEDSIKKSSGKNLIDIATIYSNRNGYNLNVGVDVRTQAEQTNGSYSINDSNLSMTFNANWDYTIQYLVPVNASTNYYLSCPTNQTNLRTSFYELDSEYKVLTKKVEQGKLPVGSITTTSNTKYLLLSITANTTGIIEISNIQLEKGQETDYEPYGKVWYIHKEIGKVNLEDYEYNKYGASAGYSRNTTTQIPNIKYVSVNTELGKGLCEKYQIHTGRGMSGSDAENHFAIDASMFQVSIPNNDTPSGLFYYALATPTYTEITNTELIEDLETLYTAKSQEGTTNISITSEDLEMILNVSALKGDVE